MKTPRLRTFEDLVAIDGAITGMQDAASKAVAELARHPSIFDQDWVKAANLSIQTGYMQLRKALYSAHEPVKAKTREA